FDRPDDQLQNHCGWHGRLRRLRSRLGRVKRGLEMSRFTDFPSVAYDGKKEHIKEEVRHEKGESFKHEKEEHGYDGGKKWIAGAIKHPGALHRQLGVPQGKKIPSGKLKAAASKGGTLGRRARLAETLKKMHHDGKKEEGHEAGSAMGVKRIESKSKEYGGRKAPSPMARG